MGERREILGALARRRIRIAVLGTSEVITDIPENSKLEPRCYWNRRARGAGPTLDRPVATCGEENLLDLDGDPHPREGMFVHEFAHAVQFAAMPEIDPTFESRLAAAFERAKEHGLWAHTYALTNHDEYWAEGAQSWFDANRANDEEHGPIDTREKLREYDPPLAALLVEVFGDSAWRYMKPFRRSSAERVHLRGLDRRQAPSFSWPDWPDDVATRSRPVLAWSASRAVASARNGTSRTSLVFVNRLEEPVTIWWIDFDGRRRLHGEIRPCSPVTKATDSGHAWELAEKNGHILGVVVATDEPARVDIH